MKNHLLLPALFLFLTIQTKAQTSVYHPFPDSNAYWVQTSGNVINSCVYNVQEKLSFSGDTIIGLKQYHRIFYSGYFINTPITCGLNGNTRGYYGAIREDTIKRSVKIMLPGNTSELLLYDFDLTVGDTLPFSYNNSGGNIVSAIDSILIGTHYRKRIWLTYYDSFSPDSNYMFLIEGIGSSRGLVAPFHPDGFEWNELNCFNQNGSTVYPDSNYSCDVTLAIHELSSQQVVNLYPNPQPTNSA